MAWRGLCSRREAEELISRGVVTVEGAVARQGDKALSDARIEIADAAGARWLRAKVTVVLNKPIGWVSNLPGPGEREASELVTARNAATQSDRRGVLESLDEMRENASEAEAEAKAALRRGGLKLNVCGRLDKDSRGLLVLTQDGALARAIIGGNEIPKTYVVRLDRPVADEQVRMLNGSVSLDGARLLPMKLEHASRLPDEVNSELLSDHCVARLRALAAAEQTYAPDPEYLETVSFFGVRTRSKSTLSPRKSIRRPRVTSVEHLASAL